LLVALDIAIFVDGLADVYAMANGGTLLKKADKRYNSFSFGEFHMFSKVPAEALFEISDKYFFTQLVMIYWIFSMIL
jgi:hypothetical protein